MLGALFLFSLAVRICFFYFFLCGSPCALLYDSGHYHEAARGLLTNMSYVNAAGDPLFYRLPGYPALLACFYKATGMHLTNSLLLQTVLAALIPVLVVLLVRRLGLGKRVSTAAGIIAAVHPGLVIYAGLVMSETLFLLFFFGFLYFFLPPFSDKISKSSQILAGLLLGGASLVRPVGHLLLPFLGAAILLFWRAPWMARAKGTLALVGGWGVLVAPWLMRNFLLTGYLFFHTLPGVHFLNHLATRAHMLAHDLTYAEAAQAIQAEFERALHQEEGERGSPLKEVEHCLVAERVAKNVIARNKAETARVACSSMLRTGLGLCSSVLLLFDSGGLLPSYDGSGGLMESAKNFLVPKLNYKPIRWVIYYEILLQLIFFLGAVWFFFCLGLVQWRLRLVMAGFVLFFVGVSLASGAARLRLPCEISFIIAAAGLMNLRRQDFLEKLSR